MKDIFIGAIIFFVVFLFFVIIVCMIVLRITDHKKDRNSTRIYLQSNDYPYKPHTPYPPYTPNNQYKGVYFYPDLNANRTNKKSKTRKEKELSMDLLLSVPFSDKDEAKKNGAWWNPEIRKWYAREDSRQPYYLNWNKYFKKWLPEHNLLCRDLYIFEMQRKCWKCGNSTSVICLATNDAYIHFDEDDSYERFRGLQLLSFVDTVSDELAAYLKENYNYYPSFSNTDKRTYYINHCKHCGSIQGDFYLHENPEEAFYKHLRYPEAEKSNYYKVKNEYLVSTLSDLPCYDLVAHSAEFILLHMETEIENRASMEITQNLINKLFEDSNFLGEIEIKGI